MSLRTDIHRAFDEVAPTTFGMPERVIQTVVSEMPDRRRRERWFSRIQRPLSMVAVLILIAVVVSVFDGGRLMHDWKALTGGAPAFVGHNELASLEARPLQLVTLQPGDRCPETPLNNPPGGLFPAGLYGSGPVYIAGGSSVSDPWGTYWYLAAVTSVGGTGLVLVRGQDLRTGQPAVFVGNWAAGPVVGSDSPNGQLAPQHVELALDPRHPPQNTIHGGTATWGFTAGLARGASGCVGWQIDTTGHSTQVIVTRSIPS